jgi:hypothetical protein
MAYFDYGFLDQDRNWSGTGRAPAADNSDKEIRTHFMAAGLQYVWDRKWGVDIQVPYWDRYFKTTDDDTGDIVSFDHGAVGDIRVMGSYTGFSPDMSTGVQLGLKLPSGDYTYAHFDRDTQIGTGSTDLLLGAYHMGTLTASGSLNWYARALLEVPLTGADHYLPGTEVDASLGLAYRGWTLGDKLRVAPLLQLIGTFRDRDAGAHADPVNTGYERLLISPGLEVDLNRVKVNANISLPLYQRTNGNQLVASWFFQLVVGYAF